MSKQLVIVESPTKAKTITKFLGKNYKVVSSFGHVRDLPKSKMGIDIDNDFAPQYVIPKTKQKAVTQLKKDAEKCDEIILATDEDREGEAIAWHLLTALDIKNKPYHRIVFHEITKKAIDKALNSPRELNQSMISAQQARRVLDRLVGYELSPFLWRKVVKGLSAGRVQSVAVRLVVEREREIEAFKPEEYWTIEADFSPQEKICPFPAKLSKINDKALSKFDLNNKEKAGEIADEIKNSPRYLVEKVEKKNVVKDPLPPFTTSTLQQEANRKLGYSAKQTMAIAQQLYEGIKLGSEGETGLITYMRTDSVNLSNDFYLEAKEYSLSHFGKDYALEKPRYFKKKSKLAQEAHEAIRPTSAKRNPDSIKDFLDTRQYKLYSLIWSRAVASQMASAKIEQTNVQISTNEKKYFFTSNGNVVVFDGYLKIYKNAAEDSLLPALNNGQSLDLLSLSPVQHFTQPPARYSDAGLVKTLESYGIGRPSTYAPTIATIIDRNYVSREEKRLKPTEIAFLVNDLLVGHFPEIVDYKFTAKMEDDLDLIAKGEKEWPKIIREFYSPFKKNLAIKEEELVKKDITEEKTDEKCDKCGSAMVIKFGRFGKFLACNNYPECKNTKNINAENGMPEENEVLDEKCPECGKHLIKKRGRFGAFYGCSGYPECRYIKNIENKTGVKCPECQTGDIVMKKSKKGRNFYACNQYPNCKYSLWSKPVNEKCPECGSLLAYGAKDTLKCSDKDCHYQKEVNNSE